MNGKVEYLQVHCFLFYPHYNKINNNSVLIVDCTKVMYVVNCVCGVGGERGRIKTK